MKFGGKLKCNVFYQVRDNSYITDTSFYDPSLFLRLALFLQDIVSVINEILYK